MKIRSGFVSNSSSASFVILKSNLTERQLKQIRSAPAYAKRLGMDFIEEYENWRVQEDENVILGTTTMDNFCFAEFLTKIGVNWDYIGWDDSNGNGRRRHWEAEQRSGKFPVIDANRKLWG